jgi:hypothetical protein
MCGILASVCFLVLFTLNVLAHPADLLLEARDDVEDHYSASQHEFGDKFQGDLLLTNQQEQAFYSRGKTANTGLLSTVFRWPKILGFIWVPYTFNPEANFCNLHFCSFKKLSLEIIFSALAQKAIIWKGLRQIEQQTCVRFLTKSSQSDYVEIINGDGCFSELGMTGGRQIVSLRKAGCMYMGTVMHEFIHVLGFDHMHNHAERDNFVNIHFENVEPGMEHNFDKVSSAFGNFNTSYDYTSLMHYPKWAFTKNGLDTIVPIDKGFSDIIGSRALSPGDVQRIKNMYKC